MRLLRSTCVFLGLLGPVLLHAAPRSESAAFLPSNPSDLTASFSVSSPTGVPGKVLKPGSYTIRVVDHLSDRIVLRIEDPEGKATTTFLGLPASALSSGSTGPVAWSGSPKSGRALRGFAFAGGSAVEFVYPKDEAVAIAKANTSKVAAIDPSSDNLPAHSNLSREDMQMVTLWSLSSTRVGPNDTPAIQAEHYKSAEPAYAQATPAPAPVTTASTDTAPVRSARPAPRPAARTAPSQQVATLHRPAVVSSLPHTASPLPLVFLLTLLSFTAAALLHVRRAFRVLP